MNQTSHVIHMGFVMMEDNACAMTCTLVPIVTTVLIFCLDILPATSVCGIVGEEKSIIFILIILINL